jgi:hypothetical protein
LATKMATGRQQIGNMSPPLPPIKSKRKKIKPSKPWPPTTRQSFEMQPFAINRLAEFWELLFIGESMPGSAHGANSKRILRFVLGADEFLHPSSHRLMVALVEFTFVQVSPFVGSTVRLPQIRQKIFLRRPGQKWILVSM